MVVLKDIIGYEGMYQVSCTGFVKSIGRESMRKDGVVRWIKERILKPSLHKHGYYHVVLYKDGKSKTYKIHQLVAVHFLGHKLSGMNTVVDHIDGNKTNNNKSNLRLVSNRENLSRIGGTSKYVGVCFDKNSNRWKAYIQKNGINRHLGLWDDEYMAHIAYQRALE